MDKNKNNIICMKNITKTFPGVVALDNVSFNLKKGEIHALMGENGAGKSTLIKVLTGVYTNDKGTIELDGKKVNFATPQQAQNSGISTVYQEVNLCLNLSVAENIFIGREPMKNGSIHWKKINKDAQDVLEKFDIDIDVTKELSMYSVAIQQMIAIARAVDISAKVLILDEPTSSLDETEVKQLFTILNKLRDEGMSIIFITHFINQVFEITDRITVLRNGKYIGSYETEDMSYMELVSKMIGREFVEFKKEAGKSDDEIKHDKKIIEITGYGKKGKINPINLSIEKGEVMGLAGLLGSGRTELARLIFGVDKHDSGVIYIDGEKIKSIAPKKAIKKGIGFCPEDRKEEGIIGELSIKENIACALQASRGVLRKIPNAEIEQIANEYVELLEIKTPSINQRIDKLSGGNQQKVILARWLATKPRLLILDEPTRGIDIGTRTEIQKLIIKLAKEGMSILLISSELEEIAACCDRVVVLRDREMVGQLEFEQVTENDIMKQIAYGGEV